VIDDKYLSGCFQDWKDLPMERLVIAGMLVGFGTKKGNGCTSGHGVCGLSSFRYRSLVATCTFMFFGIVSAIATNTYSYLPTFKNEADITNAYGMVLAVIGTCGLLTLIAHYLHMEHKDFIDTASKKLFMYILLQEFIFGLCFGIAMGVSNMTLLSAVISFLDLRYWNPSLMFVMAGSIGVATPAFYFINQKERPLFDVQFHRSKLTEADKNLLIGAAMFGMGWGLFGACPGPALVNVGSGHWPPILYSVMIVTGMYIEYFLEILMKNKNNYKQKTVHTTEGTSSKETALLVGGDRNGYDTSK
jgi:uncharacterized protein